MNDSPRFQLRKDLLVVRQERRFETVWVIKDPVAFTHFLFSDQEYFILGLLDGKLTLAEIQQKWQAQFKSATLSLEQLQLFCARLLNDNLVMLNQVGYGLRLAAKSRNLRHTLANVLRNPLVIRFRGFNPEFLLAPLAPLGNILFHPLIIALNLILATTVLGLLSGNVDELAAKLPTISQLLSSTGLVWLLVTMATIKILHEIGHGLACRKCGGDCLEIGVMLLAFTPCLFCNVSDSWLFPDRRKRILVSAAGIYVEIILAAIFAIVWFWTSPGWLNAMAFNVVLICSVNTILLNGNPLMRYDGYYVLSDLVDVPNLGQRGSDAFWGKVQRLFFHVDDSRIEAGSGWLAVYGGLSFVYRWFIIVSILSGLYVILRSYQMTVLAQIVIVITLYGLIVNSLRKFHLTGKRNLSLRNLRLLRGTVSLLFLASLTCVVLFLPLPAHVFSPAVVELKEPCYVYAPHDGIVDTAAAKYAMVEEGEAIVVLRDEELELEIRRIEGVLDQLQEHLRQLMLRENDDPEVSTRIPTVETTIREVTANLGLLVEEQKKLIVLSPCAGKIFPPEQRASTLRDEDTLQPWTGTPLDAENRGCFVARGELLAVVGDARQKVVVAYVGENDIAQVVDSARVSFSQLPGRSYSGSITNIIKEAVRVTPRELLGQMQVESVRDSKGVHRPLQSPYRVIIKLDDPPDQAFVGSTAQARLRMADQTIWSRLKLLADRLINSEL